MKKKHSFQSVYGKKRGEMNLANSTDTFSNRNHNNIKNTKCINLEEETLTLESVCGKKEERKI